MDYIGAVDQRQAIERAMLNLRKSGIPDSTVVKDIEKWRSHEKRMSNYPKISQRTYSRYFSGGISSVESGRLLFDFFSSSDGPHKQISRYFPVTQELCKDHRFVEDLMDRFNYGESGLKYSQLASVCGDFEFYRRSWHESDLNHFTRSWLKIWMSEDGIFRIKEIQNFNVNGKDICQEDEGSIVPYNNNLYAVTNSTQCMKAYLFEYFFKQIPALKSDYGCDDLVDDIGGVLLAVSGYGERPDYKFFARRCVVGNISMGHFHIDDFTGDKKMQYIISRVF
ncbi:hypothetical protein [Epibacterium ulvae]|uniref:hypothetical protein n=1 Tax=Epibacterium ulvae TaxID=1156985 RepID=UPI002492896D|nr:hypothetical protein [Epibacterium ulvae]